MKKSNQILLMMFTAFTYVCYLTLSFMHFSYYSVMNEFLFFTHTQIGLIAVGVGVFSTIGYFFGGALADYYSPKKLLIFSHFSAVILNIIFTLFPLYPVVIVLTSLSAFLVNGLLWNGAAKMVREFSTPKNVAKMFGLYLSFAGIGGTIFGLLGAYLVGRLGGLAGLNAILYIVSVYLFFAGIITWILYKRPAVATGAIPESEKFRLSFVIDIMKNYKFWILSFSASMIYPIGLAMSYFAPLLHTNYGVSLALVSTVGTFRLYLARSIFAPIGGILIQKTNSFVIMKGSIIVGLIGAILVVLLPMNSSMLVPAIIIVLAFAVAYNINTPTWYTPLGDIGIPEHKKGTAIGMYCSIIFHSDVYMYVVFGMILDKYPADPHFAYQLIYAILAVIFIIGIILLFILTSILKAEKRRKAASAELKAAAVM